MDRVPGLWTSTWVHLQRLQHPLDGAVVLSLPGPAAGFPVFTHTYEMRPAPAQFSKIILDTSGNGCVIVTGKLRKFAPMLPFHPTSSICRPAVEPAIESDRDEDRA